MTAPIPEAAKLRACELANACETTANWHIEHLAEDRFVTGSMLALARHLAELSEDMKQLGELREKGWDAEANAIARKYVLPDPVADPLVEALQTFGLTPGSGLSCPPDERAETLRKALAKRGLEIRPVSS